MDEVEAIGELAQGGLTAPAVEPAAGEGAGHTRETACLNCGTPLIGPHCHGCGQHAHVHRTIGAFLHDLVHGALHFEGKIWHTLPLLAARPGALTRRYIDGERARFVSPMALFLFSVFLMFAVFQLVGIEAPVETGRPEAVSGSALQDGAEPLLAGLRAARADMGNDNPAAAAIDEEIERLEARTRAAGDQPATATTQEERSTGTTYTGPEFALERLSNVDTGWSLLDNGIGKWRENPSLMAYKLQANSYKFSWLLIPLSVPFVWLLFAWRRRFGAYDHAVFVTYSLAFMTLFLVALTVLDTMGVGGGLLELAAVLIPPYHIYRQLKGAYGLTRFSALWRTMALLVFITIVLLLFLNLLLVLGAIG